MDKHDVTPEQEARRIVGLPPLNQADTEALVSRIATALADARRVEREECAKVCDERAIISRKKGEPDEYRIEAEICSAAIRARGDQ